MDTSNERLRTSLQLLMHKISEELGGFHPTTTLAEEILQMLEDTPETSAPPDPTIRTVDVHLLVQACAVIKTWHDMQVSVRDREHLWKLYYCNAPEMQAIRKALAEALRSSPPEG